MSDLYSEFMVTKMTTGKDKAIKVLLIALTAMFLAAGLVINPLGLLAAVIMGVVDYFVFPRLDVEYEYLYVNGELDIDKIFAKAKRKRVMTLDLAQMEILAPVKSHQLDQYNNNTSIKVVDYSSQNPEHKIYAMVVSKDNALMKVLVELDEKMFKDIKGRAPRKVFSD